MIGFDLVEKNTAWKQIKKDIDTGLLGHAYILIGEDEELLSSLLHFVTLACYCPTVCCECESCTSIAEGRNPDVFVGDGATMKVKDDILPMLELVGMSPVGGRRKVFVIKHADKMLAVGQNKLLKSFEEPPSYATFFLGASQIDGLLPTVRSRGKKIYLDTVLVEDIVQELVSDGVDTRNAQLAASYSMGNITKAKSFSQSGDYRERYEKIFRLLLDMKKSSQIAEYVVGENFSKENIAVSLDFLEIILGDVMKLTANSTAQRFTVQREKDLAQIAVGFTPQGLAMALLCIAKGREMLYYNVNAANVANDVLFGILEAKYKWKKR